MFRIETEQEIKNRIFKNINIDLNKSEGSILNDIVGVVALEIVNNQIYFKNGFDASFVETAKGEILDLRCKEHGVYRKQGKKALGKIRFIGSGEYTVPKGTNIINNNNNLKYITLSDCTQSQNTCIIESENIGIIYNASNPNLHLFKSISNISSIELIDDISGGEDIETDTELRKRLYFVVSYPEGVGTIKDYERWALEVDGVKTAKAISCYYGNGTVRVIVGGDKGDLLDDELVKRVQDYICPLDDEGYGTGKAPIGSRAIVTTFEKIPISIKIIGLSVFNTTELDTIKSQIKNNINNYLMNALGVVRYHELISVIIDSYGVKDFDDVKLNDSNNNININFDAKAILEELTYE